MKIYYINLKKSTDRRKKLLSQLNKTNIPHKRIEAVYGKDMTYEELNALCYKPSAMMCSKSMIGCYASHKKAWKQFENDMEDYGIIMEDDCILSDNFQNEVKKVLHEMNRLNPLWDFLYLGYYNLNLFSMFPHVNGKVHADAKTYTVPSGVPLGFHCYVINRRSVKKLLEVMKRMYYHVDLQFYLMSKNFNVYASKNKLAKQIITAEESTQNMNFPVHMNKLMDTVFHRDDAISPSYVLSSSLIKIPFIECHVTTYMLIFLLLMRTFKEWKTFILMYILFETMFCYDREVIASNLLVALASV